MEDMGFRVCDVIQEPVTKDHIRSWVYLFRFLGLIKGTDPNRYMDKAVANLFAYAPMTVAMFIGRSDRLHVIAERRR
jgi:hypothetical protein